MCFQGCTDLPSSVTHLSTGKLVSAHALAATVATSSDTMMSYIMHMLHDRLQLFTTGKMEMKPTFVLSKP